MRLHFSDAIKGYILTYTHASNKHHISGIHTSYIPACIYHTYIYTEYVFIKPTLEAADTTVNRILTENRQTVKTPV